MKQVTLPSGAIMKFNIAKFAKGKALYQLFLSEVVEKSVTGIDDVNEAMIAKLGMAALKSEKMDAAVWDCAQGLVVIDGEKITESYFEEEERRGDYFAFLMEVGKANLMPFMKGLFAGSEILPALKG